MIPARTLLIVALVAGCALVPARVSAQAPAESVEYYALDAIGSVRVVFDASGNVIGRMDFTPFGGELFSGQNQPHQRFAGLFRDGEAGLDYAQARSYQVRTGRFNRPDPVYAGLFDPQQWNRYTYAVSNPLSFTDETGLQAQEVISVTPECRPGPYSSCPSTITVILPSLRAGPIDVERFFNPNGVGYQGGEENARAEAQYAVNLAVSWAQGVAASFAEKAQARKLEPNVTTEAKAHLPGVKDPVRIEDGGILKIARDVDKRAGAMAEPDSYIQLYVASAAGASLALVAPVTWSTVIRLGATPAGIDFMAGFLEGAIAPTPPPPTPTGYVGFFSGFVISNVVIPWYQQRQCRPSC